MEKTGFSWGVETDASFATFSAPVSVLRSPFEILPFTVEKKLCENAPLMQTEDQVVPGVLDRLGH